MRDMVSRPISSSSRKAPSGGERPYRVDPEKLASPRAEDALTEIARAIVVRSSATEVAQVVVDEVRRLVPADRSAVWFWLPERDAIQILAVAAGTDALGM